MSTCLDSENLHPAADNRDNRQQQQQQEEETMTKTASTTLLEEAPTTTANNKEEKDDSSRSQMTTTSTSNDNIPAASNQQPNEQTTTPHAAVSAAAAATDTTTTENGSSSSTDTNANAASACISSIINNKPPTIICRFLVQNLKRGAGVGGFAKSDYHIDVVVGKHGLFDLVLQVFDILQQAEKLTRGDSYYSHLWDFDFAGVQYSYGWRDCNNSNKYNSMASVKKNHLDEQSVHPLDKLPTPLANGQKGSFIGESASFDVTLVNKAVVDNDNDDVPTAAAAVLTSAAGAGGEKDTKCWTALSVSFSSELDDDWISETCKQDMLRLRQDWSTYMGGPRIWKKKRGWDTIDDEDEDDEDTTDDDGYYLAKPLSPTWTPTELEFLGLLIRAGCKFKKSWDRVLKYVLVTRAEPATSYQWYKLQKEAFRLEWFGRGLQKNKMLLLVKRLAQSAIKKALEAGVPPLNPEHPFVDMERLLRTRGMIDDTMSPDSKLKIIRRYGPEERYLAMMDDKC